MEVLILYRWKGWYTSTYVISNTMFTRAVTEFVKSFYWLCSRCPKEILNLFYLVPFPHMSEPADDVIKRTGRFHVNMLWDKSGLTAGCKGLVADLLTNRDSTCLCLKRESIVRRQYTSSTEHLQSLRTEDVYLLSMSCPQYVTYVEV